MISTLRPWVYAVIIGFAYNHLLLTFWAYNAAELWTSSWIFESLREGKISQELFYALVYPHDIFLNLLLASPFAYALTKIMPDRKWWYVALAVIPLSLYDYRLVILGDTFEFFRVGGVGAAIGVLTALGSLPAALYVVNFFAKRKRLSNP